jgi:hypothetical protein
MHRVIRRLQCFPDWKENVVGNQSTLAIAGALALLATVTSGVVTAQSVKRPTQDLEGLWDANTMTPLQRPAEFANKATLAPEEAAGTSGHTPSAPLLAVWTRRFKSTSTTYTLRHRS